MSGARLLAARTDTAEPDAWCEAAVSGLSLAGRERSQWARCPGRGCGQLALTLRSLMPSVRLLSLGCPWQAEEGASGLWAMLLAARTAEPDAWCEAAVPGPNTADFWTTRLNSGYCGCARCVGVSLFVFIFMLV